MFYLEFISLDFFEYLSLFFLDVPFFLPLYVFLILSSIVRLYLLCTPRYQRFILLLPLTFSFHHILQTFYFLSPTFLLSLSFFCRHCASPFCTHTKMGQSRPLFVNFRFFQIPIQMTNVDST